jgi:hypothetical protein
VRRRPSPDLLLALLACAAVLALLGLAQLLEPPLTPLADAKEGARIAVDARIVETRGGRWAMLSDGHARLGAFLPRGALIEAGDMVRAEGVVGRVDDGLALSIDALEVTLANARTLRSPADLAAAPREFDGARVSVAGHVREGMLVGGGARVAMRGDEAPTEGDLIVTGTFRYHETDASYVIWVEAWTPRS